MPKIRWKDNPKLYNQQYYLENKEKYNTRARVWAKTHPEKCVAASRKWKFGLSLKEQEELLSGVCEICQIRKATHIDHCHKTNKIRGGLCNNCNTGLGMFADDPERMLRGAEYVRERMGNSSVVDPDGNRILHPSKIENDRQEESNLPDRQPSQSTSPNLRKFIERFGL